MAAAATPMTGALSTTAYAAGDDDVPAPTVDTGDDAPDVDVKVTDTSDKGLNPSDPQSIAAFTKKISDLMGRLNDSPAQTEKNRMLAWAGNLNDPSGNGSLASGVINAAKGMSDFDLKDKALRAQYTPLIINALTQQQQFAAQQKILNQPGGIPSLVGMPIDQAQRLNVALPGFKVMENWKLANPQGVTKGGSYRSVPSPGGGMIDKYFPATVPGATMPSGPGGPAAVVPNAPEIEAGFTGSHAFSTAHGKQMGGVSEGTVASGPEAGTTYKMPTASAIPGLAGVQNPFMQGLERYSGQNNAPNAANGPLNHPEQQPPAQTPPQPQAPAQGPAGPGARPMPPAGAPPAPLPSAQPGMTGNFEGAPSHIMDLIQNSGASPQEKANAIAAMDQQVRTQQPGAGPADQGNLSLVHPPAGNPPPGAIVSGPPPANAPAAGGVPPGALTTGTSNATKIGQEATQAYNQEFLTKKLPAIQEAGTNLADSNIQMINTAQTAQKNLGKTGWGTEGKVMAAKVGAALGIPGASDYATSAEKFTKAVFQNNLNVLQAQKGNQSDNDAANVAKTYATLGSQDKTNQYIFDTSRAIEERKKMQAAYYTNAVPIAKQEFGGDMSEVDRRWIAAAPPISAMPSMRPYQAEFRKAGIDPMTGRQIQK